MRPVILDRATAAVRLHSAGFASARLLAKLATRALRLVPAPTTLDRLALGASRFGGAADVPPGFRWPARDGVPLELLAQIDLAAATTPGIVAAALPGLPPRGWLLFFIDIDDPPWGDEHADADGFRLVYVDEPVTALRRMSPPPAPAARTPCRALRFTTTLDLVDPQDGLLERHGIAIDESRSWDYAEVGRGLLGIDEDTPYHHLLGHPQQRQADMRSNCQLVTHGIDLEGVADMTGAAALRAERLLATAADDWVLLLQLDSDPDLGWMWADVGRIYVWIRRTDLAARAFGRAWTMLQC